MRQAYDYWQDQPGNYRVAGPAAAHPARRLNCARIRAPQAHSQPRFVLRPRETQHVAFGTHANHERETSARGARQSPPVRRPPVGYAPGATHPSRARFARPHARGHPPSERDPIAVASAPITVRTHTAPNAPGGWPAQPFVWLRFAPTRGARRSFTFSCLDSQQR